MIGIDVGGANLKVVDTDGSVHIHYCPLWEKAPVTALLEPYVRQPDEPAVVVMSGELADSFQNKSQGIAFIVDAVRRAFPQALFYGMDGTFHNCAVTNLAAANWLASADYLKERYPESVLLDVGSTTADIIPLPRFPDLLGLSDLDRLQKGLLVYTGMLRTSIPTILQVVILEGQRTGVSTEYFAASADVHLVLGNITAAQYSCDTPDHKEKTREASLRRLARVVCSDLEEIGEDGAMEIARQFWDLQRTMIADAVRTCMDSVGTDRLIVAGIGAPLFARELGGIDLTEILGPEADALPALAVREIAQRDNVFPGSH